MTTRFSYAVSGQLLTAFEAMTPDRRFGADPDALETARAGLPWATGDWVPLLLALAARVTGVRVRPDWLEGDFLVRARRAAGRRPRDQRLSPAPSRSPTTTGRWRGHCCGPGTRPG